jgi:trehalose/maltose hydrolase-like predicted phosphorylase
MTNVTVIARVNYSTTTPSIVDVEQNISWKRFRLRRTTVHLDVGTATNSANTELWVAKMAGSWAMSMPS